MNKAESRTCKMNIGTKKDILKIVGYALLALYIVAAGCFLIFCGKMNLLPEKFLIIIGILQAIIAVAFAIMHEKRIQSIIASVLSALLVVAFVIGIVYAQKTTGTIEEVSVPEIQTDVIGVYVLETDKAQTLEDIVDYSFGISADVDRENVDKTIEELEATLGKSLNIQEYADMLVMMSALRSGKVGAIIMNEAYIGSISDDDEYEWVSRELRKITEVKHQVEVEKKEVVEVPVEVPETFVMYISGIDTYGDVSAKSRSDVNILAVVNTETKNILLLSTPRDSYITYPQTNGVRDKLTHAGIYGIDQSIEALQGLYDINVDYFMRVNFSGFEDVIDALGGIDVNSEYEFSVQNIRTYNVGVNHLTGIEALAFARERKSFALGDIQRGRHQMEVIRAVISKMASSSLLTNYTSVLTAISGSFETNMPSDQITSLVRMQLSDMAEWTVTSYTTTGANLRAETYLMPGRKLSVIDLSDEAIAEAKKLIKDTVGE